jgi:hypothetical protein
VSSPKQRPFPPPPPFPHPTTSSPALADTRKAIEDGYAARDHAQDDMAAAAIEMEKEKEVRMREWNVSAVAIGSEGTRGRNQRTQPARAFHDSHPHHPLPPPHLPAQEYSAEIEKFNAQGTPEAEEGTGTLTPEEEEALKKKIKRGNMKMAKDRAVLAMAQQKLAAFQEALQRIRTATGYDDLQDIIDLFNKYEDEKFNKVGAANRMVRTHTHTHTHHSRRGRRGAGRSC